MRHYIYETITPGGHHYIGKHSWSGEGKDPRYIGSGNCVRNYSASTPNLQNFVLQYCDSIEELNEAEKFWIAETRRIYGKLCLNIADGGDGGNLYSGMSEKEYKAARERNAAASREFNKTLWQDPEFRERNAAASRENWEDPEFCERNAEGTRKRSQDPKWREHIAEKNRKQAQDPEWQERHSTAMKELAQDPEWLERNAAAVRENLKRKFRYQNPETGEIREMQKNVAGRWLKGWICLGEVENN